LVTPQQAFQGLIDNHIRSAPVVDAQSVILGTLDIQDAVKYVVDGAPYSSTLTLTQLAAERPFQVLPLSATLAEVVQLLLSTKRVGIVDVNNTLVNIISQSTVVSYLSSQLSTVPALNAAFDQALNDVKLGSAPVITIQENSSVYETLLAMKTHHISGLAIVDRAGRLLANTSISDLKLAVRAASQNAQGRLTDLSIIEFQNAQRRAQNPLKTTAPVVCVTPTTTLAKCIGKMAATRMHRVFVVDQNKKPVAVVSVADLIKFLANAL
jgi:CBS domain-containing protein